MRAAVLFGAETGIPLAVRGGGHSISGASSCDADLVIDLSAMTRVGVDPEARIARADPGVLFGAFDVATQAYGLATTMGVNSDTDRRADAWQGSRPSRPERRPYLRQSACRGGRAGGWAHRPGKRGRSSRPVLGAVRRRRQFRCGL
jgi:FAD/FMN-containing dehydrogenase